MMDNLLVATAVAGAITGFVDWVKGLIDAIFPNLPDKFRHAILQLIAVVLGLAAAGLMPGVVRGLIRDTPFAPYHELMTVVFGFSFAYGSKVTMYLGNRIKPSATPAMSGALSATIQVPATDENKPAAG